MKLLCRELSGLLLAAFLSAGVCQASSLIAPSFLSALALGTGKNFSERKRPKTAVNSVRILEDPVSAVSSSSGNISSVSCSCGVDGCPWKLGGVRLSSPSKANLFLKVMQGSPSGAADGFHSLLSLFQALSLSDTLYVHLLPGDFQGLRDPRLEWEPPLKPGQHFVQKTMSAEGDICVSTKALNCPTSQNLVFKALRFFRRRLLPAFAHERLGIAGCSFDKPRFIVHLEKRVPMQAGLGGGSSNAATTIHACDVLLCEAASSSCLREDKSAFRKAASLLSAEVGADVPFFLLSRGSALCRGIGEEVDDCSETSQALLRRLMESREGKTAEPVYVIFKGEGGLKTKAVFAALDASERGESKEDSKTNTVQLPRDPREVAAEILLSRKETASSETGCVSQEADRVFRNSLMKNDLFEPAARLMPSLREREDALRNAFIFEARKRKAERTALFSSGLTGSGAALVALAKRDVSLSDLREGLACTLGQEARTAFLEKCTSTAKCQLEAKALSHAQTTQLLTSDAPFMEEPNIQVRHSWFPEAVEEPSTQCD